MQRKDWDDTKDALSDNAKASLTALGAALAGVIVGGTALISSWLLGKLLDLFGGN